MYTNVAPSDGGLYVSYARTPRERVWETWQNETDRDRAFHYVRDVLPEDMCNADWGISAFRELVIEGRMVAEQSGTHDPLSPYQFNHQRFRAVA